MRHLRRAAHGAKNTIQMFTRRKFSESASRKKYSGVENDYDRLESGVIGSSIPFWNESPLLTTIMYTFYAWSGFTFACGLTVQNLTRKR